MRYLIINADDFGLHPAINDGIRHGHTLGCITSTSLMAGGSSFDHAVSTARELNNLGVGIHLTLVACAPVCNPVEIPTLVDNDGLLTTNYLEFMKKYFTNKISLADIQKELEAQVQKVISTGINITHVDSHQHLHVLPGILDLVLRLAVKYDIASIRIPREAYFFSGGFPFQVYRTIGKWGLTTLAAAAKQKALRMGLAVPDYFFGMLAGGNLLEPYLHRILEAIPDGVSEIMIHPGIKNDVLKQTFGWPYHWQQELNAVTSNTTLKKLNDLNINLISFKELGNG